MQPKITARHFELTPKIRARAEKELDAITRYFENIISMELILDQERHRKSAELKVKVYNNTMTSSCEADQFEDAIEGATDKIKVQLKKYKERLKEKNPSEITELTESTTRPKTDVDAVDM